MQLKKYQRQVIRDLDDFLQLRKKLSNEDAFKEHWRQKGISSDKYTSIGRWRDILSGAPCVCIKVPTGGGKTFIACSSIRSILNETSSGSDYKFVVWLVPSDSIMQQTLKALRNPAHPYRMKLNADFNHRVTVLTKNDLLIGHGFNLNILREQLVVAVLSYDSFRSKNKDNRKAYEQNENLYETTKYLEDRGSRIQGADESSLYQVINKLNPVVVVDESHHARSSLSIDMLRDFNPRFVLELSATPSDANLISSVSALELKEENMVKLPVFLYNRLSHNDVLANAIDLRNQLEELANDSEIPYIRPIVLFQAQPKTNKSEQTFEKVKKTLLAIGIPEDQIAIKTSSIDDLRDCDLNSKDCRIRFIITVNALKEGWDCPFAYVLASLANRGSPIEVEQILGRVLRQPYAKRTKVPALNMAYVLTASSNFQQTIEAVAKGLTVAGFDKYSFHAEQHESNQIPESKNQQTNQQLPFEEQPDTSDDSGFDEVSPDDIRKEINDAEKARDLNSGDGDKANINSVVGLTDHVIKTAEKVERKLDRESKCTNANGIPEEIKDEMIRSKIKDEFKDSASIKLPMFCFDDEEYNLFNEPRLLDSEELLDGLDLSGKDAEIDLSNADVEIVRFDANKEGGFSYKADLTSKLRKHRSAEEEILIAKEAALKRLEKFDAISDSELRSYVDRVFSQMSEDQMIHARKEPNAAAEAIKRRVIQIQNEYKAKTFFEGIRTGSIVATGVYQYPTEGLLESGDANADKALYTIEEKGNQLENKMIRAFTGMDNVKWWHRNRIGEYCINGPRNNHYPDFIVLTNRHLLIIETKGDFLISNDDTTYKRELGDALETACSSQYYSGPRVQYYMVAEKVTDQLKHVYSLRDFVTNLLPRL